MSPPEWRDPRIKRPEPLVPLLVPARDVCASKRAKVELIGELSLTVGSTSPPIHGVGERVEPHETSSRLGEWGDAEWWGALQESGDRAYRGPLIAE